MENKGKKSIVIGIVSLLLVTLILLGLTYAYYRTRVIGNQNETSISVSSKNLQLTYADGTEDVNTSGLIEAGTVIKKSFTVTNNGEESLEYDVYLESVKNTFTRTEDVTYILECSSNCDSITTPREYPTSSTSLITNTIAPNETQTYLLTVTYEYLDNIDQSDDMGAELEGKVNIDIPKESSSLILTLAGGAEGDYATLNSEPKTSFGVYDKNTGNIVFTFTGVDSGNHSLKIYSEDNTLKGSTDLVINNGEDSSFESGDTPTITVNKTNRVISTNLSISSNSITFETPVFNSFLNAENVNGVTINVLKAKDGENAVNGLTLYPSMDEAYNALQEYFGISFVENDDMESGGYQTYNPNKIPSEITWTIYGEVKFDKNKAVDPYPEGHEFRGEFHVLSGGLRAIWKEGNHSLVEDPIERINVIGGNSTASLTNTLTKNFGWHGNEPDYTMTVKFSNIQFNKTFTIQQFYDETNLVFSNCTFTKEAKIENWGDVTVRNNTFNFPDSFVNGYPQYYTMAIYNSTTDMSGNVIFENNTIDNVSRGLNIGSIGSDVIIRNNTFKNVKNPNLGAIQLTNAKSILIENNVIDNVAGNALYFYKTFNNAPVIIKNNKITNTAYLAQFGDDTGSLNHSTLNITSSGNSVSVTNSGKGISEQGTISSNDFALN